MSELAIKDMKYGLIAVDSREFESNPGGDVTILHFCGYGNKPTKQDVDMFFYELAHTPEFGVQDIMEFIEVYDAPDDVVEQFREDLLNGLIPEMKPEKNGNTDNNSGDSHTD